MSVKKGIISRGNNWSISVPEEKRKNILIVEKLALILRSQLI